MKERWLYFRTALFSLVVFGFCYAYTRWLNIPGELNKAVADTAIILIGLSMVLSSVAYFWNFLDKAVIYRKYLGLVGFAFAITHVILSWDAFLNVFKISTWEQGAMWPILSGVLAMVIFTIMALISNSFSMRFLGGKTWKFILRLGYLGLFLVGIHIVLLKSARWSTWFENGMQTPPSLSLIVSLFIVVVICMRLLLWLSLKNRAKKHL